jgi:hypothetical protein
VVVVPSIAVDGDLEGSGSLTQASEERYLFMLLLLRQPRLRMIYVTSMPRRAERILLDAADAALEEPALPSSASPAAGASRRPRTVSVGARPLPRSRARLSALAAWDRPRSSASPPAACCRIVWRARVRPGR